MRIENKEWVLNWAYSTDGALCGGKTTAHLTLSSVDGEKKLQWFGWNAIKTYCDLTKEDIRLYFRPNIGGEGGIS